MIVNIIFNKFKNMQLKINRHLLGFKNQYTKIYLQTSLKRI